MQKFILQQVANFYIFLLKHTKSGKMWDKIYNSAMAFNEVCVENDIYLN